MILMPPSTTVVPSEDSHQSEYIADCDKRRGQSFTLAGLTKYEVQGALDVEADGSFGQNLFRGFRALRALPSFPWPRRLCPPTGDTSIKQQSNWMPIGHS